MYIASPPIFTKHTQRKTQTEEVCFRRVVTGFSLAPSGRHVLVDLAGGAYIQTYFHVVHCVYVCVCPIVLLLCTYRSIIQSTNRPTIPHPNIKPQASSSAGTSTPPAPPANTSAGASTATRWPLPPRRLVAMGAKRGRCWWQVGARTGRSWCGTRGRGRPLWRRCGAWG